MSVTRDRRSLPLQVREEIKQLIVGRSLQPGDQLPSEPDLATAFDVGRTTVREALKLLEQDGVISVRHGIGRFVAAPLLQETITNLSGVTEFMHRMGLEVENQVLSVGLREADDAERQALGLQTGSQILCLERARLHQGAIFIYSIDVVPRTILPVDVDGVDWKGSLMELIEVEGQAYASSIAEVHARNLDEAILQRLGLGVSQPWLVLVQTTYSTTGTPLVYSQDFHRGDQFAFTVVRRRGAS